MNILPPDTPPGLRPLLAEILDVIGAGRAPGGPTPVYACPQASLPPAARWPRTVLLVSDLNILAHSDGIQWIRQDTGVPL